MALATALAGLAAAEVGIRCCSPAGKPCDGLDGMMVLGPTGFSPNPAPPTCVDYKRASFTVGPGVAGSLWVDGVAEDVVIPKIGSTSPASYC